MKQTNAIIDVVAAIIYRLSASGPEFLIARRSLGQSGAGEWEFPGGKVEAKESRENALKREIKEELSLDINIEDFIAENTHAYPQKTVHLMFYLCRLTANSVQSIKLTDHDQIVWASSVQFSQYSFSQGDRWMIENFNLVSRLFPRA